MARKPLFEPIVPRKPIKFGKLADVSRVLLRFGRTVQSRMSDYPPQRPGTTYRRTGEFGRRWTVRAVPGRDLVLVVGSNLEYAPHVGGFKTRKPKQTRVAAQAGWPSAETVGKEEWGKVKPKVEDALQGR